MSTRLVALTFALFACNLADARIKGSGPALTESRTVGDFKSISAGGAIELTVAVGSATSVTVSADDNVVPVIRTRVKGDRLIIDSKDSYDSKHPVRVAVTAPALTALELSGASTGVVAGLTADQFALQVSGAARARLKGTATTVAIEANGAAVIDADALTVRDATVGASGASKVLVNVTGGLTVAASGASAVRYLGSPSVTKDVSGAATVKPR
jgi:hypothetical protein